MRSLAGVFVLFAGCSGPDKDTDAPVPGDSSPDTASTGDTAPDTGTSDDVDGDGFALAAGDCDDADPTVHPGADETSGDGVDQDCDGSDFVGVAIGSVGQRADGSADDMTFGEVVRVVGATDDALAAILVSETAVRVGKLGGMGQVHVFAGGEDPFATAADTVLRNETAELFGQAVGVAPLEDGGRAWLVGFYDITHSGGVCAWDDRRTGIVGGSEADACIPRFADPDDRPSVSFASSVDLDGDGVSDLAMGGLTQENGVRVGALWLTRGPLDFAALGTLPALVFGGLATQPRLFTPGDLDQDGYDDLIVSDPLANDANGEVGSVYIVPGGLSLPASVEGLARVDGDQPSSNAGAGVATPDLNGDGTPDLCVSAPLDGLAGERAGRVGCFYGPISGRHTLGEADVSWTAEAPNSFFGFSMGSLDLDGDGDDELAVGVPDDPYFSHGWPGKVYLFDPDQAEPVGLLVGERGDGLGFALGTGDVNGDGRDDLVVGAPWADGDRGAAYLVFGGDGAW